MSPILLLVALMGVGVVTGATGQCLQPSRCAEVDAEVDAECRLMVIHLDNKHKSV